MATWSKFLLTNIPSDATAPAGEVRMLAWIASRLRPVIHNGSVYKDIAYRSDFPCGQLIQMAYKKTTSETFPYVDLSADADLSVANWPVLVPELRAVVAEAWGGVVSFDANGVPYFSTGSAMFSSFTGTVAGSVFTGPADALGEGNAFTNLLNALNEELLVQRSATKWLCFNIGGTDYAITAISPGSRTITVSGSPPTGSQTGILYRHRIAGSTTTARVFKGSGRSIMFADGGLYVGGLRRRDHGQGHGHSIFGNQSTSGGARLNYAASTTLASAGNSIQVAGDATTTITDGANGTPRPGPLTESASISAYLYMNGQQYAP